MCAWLPGIAAEGAVAAVIAAKIGEREKHFARIGDDAGLEFGTGRFAAASRSGRNSGSAE